MEFRDYYAILGVERDASEDDLKRAYRRLARKTHPDVSDLPDAEARFKEIGEAYEVLRDVEKRAAYDQLGSDWKAGESFAPAPDWNEGFVHHWQERRADETRADFSEFFNELFGRRSYEWQALGTDRDGFIARGEDRFAKLAIDIEETFGGASRGITLKHAELGPDGRPVVTNRTLDVQIPRGIRAGQHIRLVGQGGKPIGKGHPGDLYLQVEFREHPLYWAEGADLYLELPVAPWEAVLGANVQVPTPNGSIELSIPSGSRGGRKLRLSGRGIPSATPGDLYIVLRVVLPDADSDKARRAYRSFEQSLTFDPRKEFREHVT